MTHPISEKKLDVAALLERMHDGEPINDDFDDAADEIERLTKKVDELEAANSWSPIETLDFDPTPDRPVRIWHPRIGESIARARYGQCGIGSAVEWAPARTALNDTTQCRESDNG